VKLLQALIEQGQANEALQEIVRRGAMSDTVAIQILDSLYQKGYREEAQRLADALSDKLMKSGLIARQMPLNHFGVNPVKHFGTVQVATRYGQLRVQITEPDRTFGALVGMYAKWGLHTKTERLLSALPPDRKLFYRIHLASIYQAAGQPARARQDLERVLQEIPRVLRADKFDTQVALMLVACAYAQLGDYPHALTLAQRISPRHQREVLRAILVDRLEARHYSEERRLFWSEWVEVAQ
jgi:tetratricopeptide (TPR) repeat protein